MRHTRKGTTWYFGMTFHVGTDPQGLVHRLTGTDAATADITQLPGSGPPVAEEMQRLLAG